MGQAEEGGHRMKVWVRKTSLLGNIHSLPFRAWAQSFNEWVPGDMQERGRTETVRVYFYPFAHFGRASAVLRITDINVDADTCKRLIRGGLPVLQYEMVRSALKLME